MYRQHLFSLTKRALARRPLHYSGCCCCGAKPLPLCGSASTTLTVPHRCSSSSNYGQSTMHEDPSRPYAPGMNVEEKYPVVQLPARSLWCKQYPLAPHDVRRGEFEHMIEKVKDSRHYYQYPSMSAPQIGWNVQMFTLFDGSVFINPVNLDAEEWKVEAAKQGKRWVDYEEEKLRQLREEGKTGFAWEPCASCGFMLHYIERPTTVRLRALNERGESFEVALDKMRARMALHELDHLDGILFTRRVVDTNHVIPMEGFTTMSDWSDDYPSLEARSTFLYTIFTPPYHFISDLVEDASLLDRKYEDGIYPGCERDRQLRIESVAMEEARRGEWKVEKKRQEDEAKYGKASAGADMNADD